MRRFLIYIENLEYREKWILIVGIYLIILIVGVFFITMPLKNRLFTLEKKVNTEIENYRNLADTASEYLSLKGNYTEKDLSLSEIEKIATTAKVKENIVSLKPINGENIEISLEGISWKRLVNFIKRLKMNGYTILAFSMEKPGEKNEVNARIVIGE